MKLLIFGYGYAAQRLAQALGEARGHFCGFAARAFHRRQQEAAFIEAEQVVRGAQAFPDDVDRQLAHAVAGAVCARAFECGEINLDQ